MPAVEEIQNIIRKARVRDENGLHLKVASEISRACAKFTSRIRVARGEGMGADCRSPLALLTLGASREVLLTVTAEGDDAPQAMKALEEYFLFNP